MYLFSFTHRGKSSGARPESVAPHPEPRAVASSAVDVAVGSVVNRDRIQMSPAGAANKTPSVPRFLRRDQLFCLEDLVAAAGTPAFVQPQNVVVILGQKVHLNAAFFSGLGNRFRIRRGQ